MEAFSILNQRYENLELVMRTDIDEATKARYANIPNVRFIDKPLSRDQIDAEFSSADIFFLPAHETPLTSFLEAMSYELPIVTIDASANDEIVEDGKTGYVIRKSPKIPYYVGKKIFYTGTSDFRNIVKTYVDQKVVKDLANRLEKLIEEPSLRRKLGRTGRYEVEKGRFSLARRNNLLKEIFEKSI